MTIKRKDGSIFSLTKPNPIMQDQSFWDDDKVILHNFNYEEISFQSINYAQEEKKEQNDAYKQTIHCLIAEIREVFDPLYEETKTSISYKNKLTCEAILITNDVLKMTFWTEEKLTRGTIVYVPDDRCWWKIQEINDVYECVPSDIQPSF